MCDLFHLILLHIPNNYAVVLLANPSSSDDYNTHIPTHARTQNQHEKVEKPQKGPGKLPAVVGEGPQSGGRQDRKSTRPRSDGRATAK